MLGVVQEMIRDAQALRPDTGVPRSLRLQPPPGKASVCIGVRRCGKSTLLLQEIERLAASGTPRERILYVNFFDDRLRALREHGIGLITDAYFAMYPRVKDAETVHCFFDEIQDAPDWEPYVDRLMRTERCRVYLTGSSARMLAKEIATQMRGRSVSWELFPFSFREFLRARGVEVGDAPTTKQRMLVMHEFDRFWETGAFPEVIGLDARMRTRVHQEYLSAILFRDVVERYDVAHPRALADMVHRLMDNTASLHSVNSLTGYLKSLGHHAPKSSVSDYLEWLEDAYFLFTVPVFDASITRRRANPRKVYCVDHALAASVASGILLNSGHLLENLVFVALRRVYPSVFYYKTRSGLETDFAVPRRREPPLLVQVCESLAQPEARRREQAALSEAMAEAGASEGVIVTRNDTATIAARSGKISVTPCWRFLLDLPEEAS